MSFKKSPSLNLSYKKQGYIYFACLNYAEQSAEVQHKIKTLCMSVGGKWYNEPLFKVLTTEEPINRIAREYYMSSRQLRRLKNKFYLSW